MELVEEYKDCSSIKTSIQPWLVCFAASLFFFYEFVQGNMFASIADNIMHDFGIQADVMAALSSIYYLSNVIFLVFAAAILDRFSGKKTIILAMLLCVGSTFILAHTESLYVALACRFITGIGSAFCFIGPIRIATRWFPPAKMALVTGLIVTMAMTGGMLAQYPLTKMVLYYGWRESVMIIGWLGVSFILLMIFWIKDKPNNKSIESSKPMSVITAAKKAYLKPQSIGAAMYTSLMNMAVALFGAMAGTLYLMQRLEIPKETASMINSMLFLGTIFGGPIIGYISDKIGLRILPMKIGVFSALILILTILYVPVSPLIMGVLFFALGFVTAAQVISYALVAESMDPTITATAVSIVSILTQGGYVVYQNLFSKLLIQHGGMQMVDNVPVYSLGDYQYAAGIIPIGFIIAIIMVFRLKETYCKQTNS